MTSLEPVSINDVRDSQAEHRTGDINRLVKGASVSTAGKMIGRGLNFLGQVVLARLLGPEGFGLYAIGWSFLRIISIIGPLGMDSAVIRFGAKYWRKDNREFTNIFVLTVCLALLSGLLIGAFFFLAAPWLAVQIFHKPGLEKVFIGFACAIPLVTTLRVVASATSVSQQMKYATYSEEISQPAFELILVLIFFYAMGWKLEGAVLASILSFGIALALACYYMNRLQPERTSWREITFSFRSDLIRFSIPTAFAALFGSFIAWVDRLLVGFFLSEADTGIYTTISLIAIIFAILLSGIKVIFSPMIADMYHKGEMKRVEELYRVSTKWGLYISIPLFLIILFSAPNLLRIAFGEAYVIGYIPLLFLAFAQLVNIGTGPIDILLIMTGHQKTWLTISGIMLGVDILVISLLAPRFGLLGAAIGTAISVIGIFVIGLVKVKRDLHIWPYDRRYYKGLLASGVTAGVMAFVSRMHISSPMINVVLITTVAFLTFGIVLLAVGLDREDQEMVQMVKNKIILSLNVGRVIKRY